MSTITSIRAVAASAALLAAVGCASTPQPLPDVVAARALVSQAEQSDASQFASGDLESARSKLRVADQDSRENKPILAAQMAQESSVDAEVAMARTRAIKSEQALNDVNAGTGTLRSESLRQEQASPPAQPSTVIVVPADSVPVQR
jgi:hypothetical protein